MIYDISYRYRNSDYTGDLLIRKHYKSDIEAHTEELHQLVNRKLRDGTPVEKITVYRLVKTKCDSYWKVVEELYA